MARDDDEDFDRPKKRPRASTDADVVGAIIPYRNGMALAAYYTGVFGLISCFLFGVGGLFGIIPITLGILGLVKAGRDGNAGGRAHAWVGIALGGLELLVGCGTGGFFLYSMFIETRR